ncbi:LysR family transcriptional regulator [Amylibacter sp. SFDW26]|uniref:LysR family transcriptional regulator n=1 Tax=Amylibacter sp. SFDW26 TaxID=2652722 RepID=UPI001261581A|nr:LysR family transcriptional regulator [Amylibacter sp. SFDW26]KAB7610495.1 LysR family transcriptional regulator [Amylibacter sp. SFDW26]
MNLRDFLYVIAVAEHRNFTRAAKVANVSQPALSNQIKKLEMELGFEIFERGNNEVVLTGFGADFLDVAHKINGLVDSIDDLTQKHNKIEATPLRLGITPTLAAYLSKYFRELFSKLYPDMRLIIVEEYPKMLAKMIDEKTVDIAFIARKSYNNLAEPNQHSMDFSPLWMEPLFLGVRKGHPLTQKTSIHAYEVPANLLIRFETSFGYDLENDLPAQPDNISDLVGIDVRSARFETVCRYVAQSDACTMVNAIAAKQLKNDSFGLDFIPFDGEGNMRELGALTRVEYPHPEMVEAICAHIRGAPPLGTLSSD